MKPIDRAFRQAREERRAALIAYLAAGDPDLDTTRGLARAAAAAGADIIELGIPFSDPLADGPIIQAAYTRALARGTSVKRILEWLPRVTGPAGPPVVLMTAWNPVLAYGPGAFCRDAAAAGAAAVLVPDLLPEDSGAWREMATAAGLQTVFLAAPDTTDQRTAAAAAASTGFLYLISRRGVTGPEGGVGGELKDPIARARRCSGVPIAVGFGVASADDARRVAEVADGVIAGSVLVRAAAEAKSRRSAEEAVGARTRDLMDGIRRARKAER